MTKTHTRQLLSLGLLLCILLVFVTLPQWGRLSDRWLAALWVMIVAAAYAAAYLWLAPKVQDHDRG